MISYIVQAHLLDVVDEFGEEETKKLLSSFRCPKNQDVEKFINKNAIDFAKKKIAQTYLVVAKIFEELHFIAFYSLAYKEISIPNRLLSQSKRKIILRNGRYDANTDTIVTATPLIAQLGKNYSNLLYPKMISGKELLDLATLMINNLQYFIGGNSMYIECAPNQKLIHFYEENGFFEYKRRTVNPTETSDEDNPNTLVQMAKIG